MFEVRDRAPRPRRRTLAPGAVGSLIPEGSMGRRFAVGDCVQVPDGRVGRVRAVEAARYQVRVRRRTSRTHQFLLLRAGELSRVECPGGWMSPDGYRRYLASTLAKLRERQRAAKSRRS
jgi:hypothetical protein